MRHGYYSPAESYLLRGERLAGRMYVWLFAFLCVLFLLERRLRETNDLLFPPDSLD